MTSRIEVQVYLNTHRQDWGKGSPHVRPLWDTVDIDRQDVLRAGVGHSCMVISKVLAGGRTDLEIWRSYTGKNQAFADISELFLQTNRLDLFRSWNRQEVKKHHQVTHQSVKALAQYPDGFHRQTLPANARMVQYYVSDHLKTLDHIYHGALPNFANNPEDQQKFLLTSADYANCALEARNVDHFCALMAVHTAQVLKSRGVDSRQVAQLLSQNFAQTGIVQENGQQKPAQRLVNLIIKEIKETGQLPGLSSEFRRLARPKVQSYYLGHRNPRL